MISTGRNHFRNRLSILAVLCLLLYVNGSVGKIIKKRGIMDNINSGIKYAGQMLGINTAADVANLVSKAFSPNSQPKNDIKTETKYDSDDGNRVQVNPFNFVNGVLRMIGLDSGKLGALAINGILFIAQMIGNSLIKNNSEIYPAADVGTQYDPYQPRSEAGKTAEQPGRTARTGSPLDWMLENPSEELQKLLVNVRDKNLPEYLADTITGLEHIKGEGDCIKLLICKSAPIIWGMQKAVSNRIESGEEVEDDDDIKENRMSVFFKYLPDAKEFQQHGHLCEHRYSNCNTSRIA